MVVWIIGCEQYSSEDHTGNNLLEEQCPVHRIPNHCDIDGGALCLYGKPDTPQRKEVFVASLHRIHKLALTNTSTKKSSATKKMHL